MEIKVIRSHKRRKTVQARKRDNRLEVLAPAHLSDAQLQPHIDSLLQRIERRDAARQLNDSELQRRAQQLNRNHYQGRLRWNSIRWVTTQKRSYGSCCTPTGNIRISDRLAAMPSFVLDYVIMHELAHLLEPNHSPQFWQWVNRYERTERARGFLMGAGFEAIENEDHPHHDE